jgi:hypothetical protein
MPAQIRFPYYRLDLASFYAVGRTWQLSAKGCAPLKNPQAAILMERQPPPLPGEKAAAKADAKAAKEQAAAAKALAAADKVRAKGQQAAQAGGVQAEKTAFKVADNQNKSEQPGEECKAPPPFDMLDLPDAMERMGWPVASKLSRRWFNGRKHRIPADTPASFAYPPDMVDTKTVTLDFILKYQKAREKFDDLVLNRIYTAAALDTLKIKTGNVVGKPFTDGRIPYSSDLDTLTYCGSDIQKLDNLFRFQRSNVSNFDTLNGRFLTDLTASLANFDLNVAVANASIKAERYYSYPNGAPAVFCCQFHVEVTHVYVYARDSYSFADGMGQKASQYLGHWNHTGVILVLEALAADRANRYGIDIELGSTPSQPMPGPVDTLQGWFSEMRKQDVYYPVRNRDYSTWREKFNRGGDFLILTEPKKIKLPNPIKFAMEELCRPAPQPSGR